MSIDYSQFAQLRTLSPLEQYQHDALRTESPIEVPQRGLEDPQLIRLLHSALGLASDLHELSETREPVHFIEEAGDVFWFLALGYATFHWAISGMALATPDYFFPFLPPGNDPQVEPMVFTHGELDKHLAKAVASLLDFIKARLFYGRTMWSISKLKGVVRVDYDTEVELTFTTCVLAHLNLITALMSAYCRRMEFEPQAIMDANIAKLRARYPLKFTAEAAVNRDSEKEYAAVREAAQL